MYKDYTANMLRTSRREQRNKGIVIYLIYLDFIKVPDVVGTWQNDSKIQN